MTTPSIGVNQIESEAGSRQPRHLSSTCCPNKGLCGVHRGSYPPTPLTATEAIAYVECVVCGEMLRTLDNCPHCGRSLYIDI